MPTWKCGPSSPTATRSTRLRGPHGAEHWEGWHRDAQDKRLVECSFTSPTSREAPTSWSMFRGVPARGRTRRCGHGRPGDAAGAPASEFAERVPDSAIRTLSPRTGTIVLCNASGLHREGFTAQDPQVLWKCSYSSPAALLFTERKFRVQLPEPCDLSQAARFAVS